MDVEKRILLLAKHAAMYSWDWPGVYESHEGSHHCESREELIKKLTLEMTGMSALSRELYLASGIRKVNRLPSRKF